MSVCLLIMCIALCVTLSASSGSFPMFFPKTILPLCTSLPHVFGQQRQRQSNAMLFGETLQGVAKNVWAMCCTTPCLVCCLQCVPLLLCFFLFFCVCTFLFHFSIFFFCVAVCCLQCVPLAQKLGNEAGRSQGGEKTHAVINQ